MEENLLEVAERAEDIMGKHNLFGSISLRSVEDTDPRFDIILLVVDIENGDWKHEHGYLDTLMIKEFDPFKVEKETYGDLDDDCYSCKHKYWIKKSHREKKIC